MTERWKKKVEPHIQDAAGFCRIVDPMDVVNLLARQHRAMVRMVKKMQKPYLSCVTEEQRIRHAERVDMCADILAALAKQGARKKD